MSKKMVASTKPRNADSEKISFVIDPEDLERLRKEAVAEDVTVSFLIRKSIKTYFKTQDLLDKAS